MDNDGHAILTSGYTSDQQAEFTAFDEQTGAPIGSSFVPSDYYSTCGAKVVQFGSADLLRYMTEVEQAAQGVQAARTIRRLHAYDFQTGAEAWAVDHDPTGCESFLAGTLHDQVVQTPDHISAVFDGEFIDLATGSHRWLQEGFQWAAVIADRYVVGQNQPTIYASNGKDLGSAPATLDRCARHCTTIDGKIISIGDVGDFCHAVAVRADASSVIWTNPTNYYCGASDAQTYDGDHDTVLASGLGGTSTSVKASDLVAFDTRTGRQLWTQGIDSFCGVLDHRVYVIANGQQAQLDLRTGHQLSFDATSSDCPILGPDFIVEKGSQSPGPTDPVTVDHV